ncbi:MAG: hypothetical protein DDT31_01781 [Syntrophomonadaceae bacterium]|nr:hypothetical protein [Bacillota bacterium]
MKVRIFEKGRSLYVDGREAYLDPSSKMWWFKDNFTSAASYGASQEILGRPLAIRERVFFRDGNKSNLYPQNLYVAEQGPSERRSAFHNRVKLTLEGRWKRLQKLEQRVPDLYTREIAKEAILPLKVQITNIQKQVDKVWRGKLILETQFKVPFNMEDVTRVARNMIILVYPDVRIEDIILDEVPLPVKGWPRK